MFTGLIETTGRIDAIDRDQKGGRLRIRTALGAELRPGDSVSVSGVCLTVTTQTDEHATFDVAPVTLDVTTLGSIAPGRPVNLERALRAGDRMGGHFVLGHVDGTSSILSFERDGESGWLEVRLPVALAPYVIPKGSIAVDGISLTVAALSDDRISMQIVPFTLAHTSLDQARTGDAVNLETDVLGKYVVRWLAARKDGRQGDPATLGVPDALTRVLSGDMP
jgi:riboflavin synthase